VDKIAIVTGGRRGIGLAISKALIEDYYRVVVVAQSKDKPAIDCDYIQADLRYEDEAQEVIKMVLDNYERLDVLVNNAGYQKLSPALEMTRGNWLDTMAINLTSPWLLSQYAASHMKDNGGGKIINIASVNAFRATRNNVAYCASKAALVAMTGALACEWAKYGINVNAIAPGFIETDMTVETVKRTELLERIPAGYFGKPEDIVGAVRFLLSPGADYVHGSTIVVDGGWCAKN
jgi:2-deoxy-D-gluconate 3-dehydrogenase